jgi:hypothetical protein
MHIGGAHDQPAPRSPAVSLHKVVAAVADCETDGVVTALTEAGFARDRVEVVTAALVPDLDKPVGRSGLHELLTRLNLSLGDDLGEIEQARRELMYGHTLILVMVHGDVEQERAHAVLRQHGGHAMHYFGRWAIRTLEGEAH